MHIKDVFCKFILTKVKNYVIQWKHNIFTFKTSKSNYVYLSIFYDKEHKLFILPCLCPLGVTSFLQIANQIENHVNFASFANVITHWVFLSPQCKDSSKKKTLYITYT
jgi:hypothetical protein